MCRRRWRARVSTRIGGLTWLRLASGLTKCCVVVLAVLSREEAEDPENDASYWGFPLACAPDSRLRRATDGLETATLPSGPSYIHDHVKTMDLCANPEWQYLHGSSSAPHRALSPARQTGADPLPARVPQASPPGPARPRKSSGPSSRTPRRRSTATSSCPRSSSTTTTSRPTRPGTASPTTAPSGAARRRASGSTAGRGGARRSACGCTS